MTYSYWSKKGLEGTAEEVGPSAVALPREGIHPLFSLAEYLPLPRELSGEEIESIVEAAGDAAVRARKAGFDALELQCIGGNLLHRFTNPFLNRRTDRYGGDIQNRLRFLVEAIENVKRKVGADFPMICRITGLDTVPWGLDVAEWKKIASLLEKAGVHALNIYPRWYESRDPLPQMCVPRMPFVHLAAAIKEAVRIPVIAAVRINDPKDAEMILEAGKADFIGMGRPLIADPELPRKAKEGRLEEINLCTACCRCYDDVAADKFMSCAVNALAGEEGKLSIGRAGKPKKVFVIGGGPAGMEAARVGALRGHHVTLFEAGAKLGGQLLFGTAPPYKEEWKNTVSYLSHQLEKLKVRVELNNRCTPRKIEEEKPDAVIVATGARALIPNWPGIPGPNVVSALDVLGGRVQTGSNVVIIGGGQSGCETAELLAQQGKRVTILEMLGRIGAQFGPMNRWVVIDRLVAAGIRLETGVKVEAVTGKGVRVTRAGYYPEFFAAETVVLAVGMVSDQEISSALAGKVSSLTTIGDAAKPATVKEAIESGFKTALAI